AGLGPIGDGRGQGLLLHTTVAVLPRPRQVLGLAHQQLFLRRPHPERPRKRRPPSEAESRVWSEAVSAIGGPPSDRCWVVVADAGGDGSQLLLTCRAQSVDFLIRVASERRLLSDTATP